MPSDYDGAWKDLLHARFLEALTCYFPEVAEAIDPASEPEFLDQELRELKIDPQAVDNRVDLLVRVGMRDGRSGLLYLHLEVQSFREEGFAKRIFECYSTLRRACGSNVISLAVLADLDSGWLPDRHFESQLGCSLDFRFPCCKLLQLEPQLAEDDSLPALAAKAQLAALRTSGDMDLRLKVRMQLIRRFYELGYRVIARNKSSMPFDC